MPFFDSYKIPTLINIERDVINSLTISVDMVEVTKIGYQLTQ